MMGVLSVLVIAACASPPMNIRPADVDASPYQAMSCIELEAAVSRAATELADASERQSAAADKDALWVFLLFLPMASMQGEDIGDEVAELKGRLSVARKEYAERCT
jgi:hypothetical protein